MLFEEFPFTGDVSTITLGGYVFTHGGERLAGNYLGTDGRLNGDHELLTGQELAELLTHAPAYVLRFGAVNEGGEGINVFAVELDVHPYQICILVVFRLVIEAGVAPADGLEAVVKVEYDFGQRQLEVKLYALRAEVGLLGQHSPLLDAEVHDRADVIGGGNDLGEDDGLLHFLAVVLLGQFGRVADFGDLAFGIGHAVGYVRYGRDYVHPKFAEESFLHDLQVEHTEESTAETVAEGGGGFGFENEACVVELQLFEAVA